jgi:aminopeptidase N
MTYSDERQEHRAFALPGSRPQYGPDRNVVVEQIDIDAAPDLERETLDATCTTTLAALDEEVERIALDAVDLRVASVERDGRPLAFAARDGKLDILLDPPLRAGERTKIAVRYRVVQPRHGLFFVKPTPAHPEKVAHVWTQCQDENARYWFPCLDYPHAKQRTSMTVTVPKGMFALSNGRLVERTDRGSKTIFRYEQDVPHSTYLVTMVAGPFVEVAQGAAGKNATPVFYYVLPGREADGERAFGKTPRMIGVLEERIGVAYPYARYSQIAVSDFIFGGMENTSATTQTDRTLHDEAAHLDFSSDPLVAHELAHQWFGDLLTCRDWSHAWLNEGFATFFEAIWREADLGYDEYLYDIFECVATYLIEDADRYRRPLVCNTYRNPIEIFDRHLYQKGAAILHMLRGELGEARFWRSMRQYVERNAQRNVETIDFIRAIEETCGRNMRAFFDQWVFRGGHPELEVSYAWDPKRKTATVTIDQKQKIDSDNPPYRFNVEIALDGRRIPVLVEHARETVSCPLEAEPALVQFDPGAFVLADVTYKLGVDLCAAILHGGSDVVARIRAARELAKDGSLPAREALERAVAAEPFWGVLAELAGALGATKAPWACRLLAGALAHRHPKVRRAVARALGNFRGAQAAEALVPVATGDVSYFVRAEALAALGKTRDAAAFEVLRRALEERTWNATVESGAAKGLAELADARAMPLLIGAARAENDDGLRRAAASAIGRVGELVAEERTRAVNALEPLLDDEVFHVQLAAIAASESLGDARLLGALGRLSQTAFDARLRRDAAEAIVRIREMQTVPAQVAAMRDEIDELREEQRKLQEKIETLSRA